jgi:UDP-N-acetylmuramate--L-alanine ligase/undecaprenyldiphospho-muramoylpentapeptide beta-N-acetylglucosaminyltransferase
MARIVVAAGGTAGHVVPALAIADELRARGAEVFFIGTRERAESELVPAAGYEIFHLSVTGLDRRRPLRGALALLRSAAAVIRALRLLARLRPDAVLGAGGYIAGPVGLAAALRRTPIVLTESDSRLGLANRLLTPFARRVCLAFPIAGRSGSRYLVTGRPVPQAVLNANRHAARERLGVDPEATCLLVFGGSLGARSINNCAFAAYAERSEGDGREATPVVLHVAGRRDYPELVKRLERIGRPAHYHLYDYVEGTLADPLAAADLVLGRAGGSLFELAAAGKPSVLVPYPHATAAHQWTNARFFADAGAAVVIADDELAPQRLRRVVDELASDRERLRAMAAAARSLARPDAAKRVASELLAAVQESLPWRGRQLHFVGIGGAGMSGLALVARELGAQVSGCDRAESAYMRALREQEIESELGHSPEHVTAGIELVVSTAIPEDTPELRAARERGVPIAHRGALLAEVASLRSLLAVTGTHGKTTTAAMAACCLRGCGLNPGFLVGGEVPLADGGSTNAEWGAGAWLVAEADESDRSLLELSPQIAVVTNVELDHHTTYGSLLELEDAFRLFLERLPGDGTAVLWNRVPRARLAPAGRRVVSYDIEGSSRHAGVPSRMALQHRAPAAANLSARNLRQTGLGTRFELARDGEAVCEVELGVPGRHNVLNALAALAACEQAGCGLELAAQALAAYRGAARRFEQRGEGRGIRVFDDYAHHPTEVGATLQAARALEPRRLVAVFQPHLYSRTLHLHRELGRELARADLVVVLDVYPARERPEGEFAGVTGKLVADACADYAEGRPVWWLPTLEEAETVLARRLADGDVVVTLGAGDVDRLADRLAARLDGKVGG